MASATRLFPGIPNEDPDRHAMHVFSVGYLLALHEPRIHVLLSALEPGRTERDVYGTVADQSFGSRGQLIK